MPPDMTNKELTEAVQALQNRKLKVSDLPMAALQLELAKEPKNPAEILLPHAIGADLLASTVTDHNLKSGAPALPVTVTSGTPTTIYQMEVPTAGFYIACLQADCECNVAGYLVLDLEVPGGTPQTILNPTGGPAGTGIGDRIPNFIAWPLYTTAGSKVGIITYMAGGVGKFTLQNIYLWFMRIG